MSNLQTAEYINDFENVWNTKISTRSLLNTFTKYKDFIISMSGIDLTLYSNKKVIWTALIYTYFTLTRNRRLSSVLDKK